MAGSRAARAVTIAARLFVGVVFLAAGALKAADPAQAPLAVGAYDLLPPKAALAVGFLLPGVEIAAGAALVTAFLVRGAALVAAALSVTFLVAIASAHFRGLDIACGCFGALSPALESGLATAALDVVLLAASLHVWRRHGT
jgi:uncharacterized membrane protein YphA (DoxX/SURF4 family)